MNQYPLWKYVLIVVVLTAACLFAAPNLYEEDYAVQVSAGQRDVEMNDAVIERVEAALARANIKAKSVALEEGRLLVRFTDPEVQLAGNDAIRDELKRGFIVALNLAPTTPGWLRQIGALPMYLGLDLRGGVHFLMEVDMDAAVSKAEERYVGDLRSQLREEKIRYKAVLRRAGEGVVVALRKAEDVEPTRDVIRRENPGLTVTVHTDGADSEVRARLSDEGERNLKRFALQQNITTLRNRVNELGVAEPVIQQQGEERIVVQLPGVQDTAKAKRIIGATATLDFRMVDDEHNVSEALAGRTPIGSRLYYERNGNPVLLKRQLIISGDYITDASSGIEQQSGSPAVFITLDGRGARIMSDRTKNNIGRPMAVVYIENKRDLVKTEDGKKEWRKRVTEEVINIATIRDRLGARFQITGLDGTEEARDLALLLRAGALAAPVTIIEERTVGPSLGKENIEQGKASVQIGFILVLVFMAVYYRVFGLIADVALACNLVLIVSILSLPGIQATLTLPGIAGIVLTVGMAVDANVLIFERIREELRNGNSPQASIHAGYQKAFSTIADANITTLIAAVVLYGFGTGPIKGFAVTLSIGIITSMFTAIVLTRAIVNLIYGGKRVERLPI
jgi:preprotein translocase subunit SecD